MAASLRGKKKEQSALELVQSITKSIGLDISTEYDSDAFAQLWVDLYQSEDPEAFQLQGEYLYNLLQQLTDKLENSTSIIPAERRTKIWNTRNLQLQNATDSEIVDEILYHGKVNIVPILEEESVSEIHLLVINPDD